MFLNSARGRGKKYFPLLDSKWAVSFVLNTKISMILDCVIYGHGLVGTFLKLVRGQNNSRGGNSDMPKMREKRRKKRLNRPCNYAVNSNRPLIWIYFQIFTPGLLGKINFIYAIYLIYFAALNKNMRVFCTVYKFVNNCRNKKKTLKKRGKASFCVIQEKYLFLSIEILLLVQQL